MHILRRAELALSAAKQGNALNLMPELLKFARRQKELYEGISVCIDCGKHLDDLTPDSEGVFGTICLDPGSSGSEVEPSEPSYLFMCCSSCGEQYHVTASTFKLVYDIAVIEMAKRLFHETYTSEVAIWESASHDIRLHFVNEAEKIMRQKVQGK